jgi:hypothetical protein
MNLSGTILALFMQITMHHHTFLNLGDCAHVQPFSISSPQSCFRETLFHFPMTGDTNSLHEVSPQISAVETAVPKGVLPFDIGR